MAAKIDLGKEISRGWELFKEPGNIPLLVIVNLLAGIISLVTCGILAGPMMAGVLRIIQRLVDKDPVKPQIGDLFKGFDKFVDTLLFIVAILVVGGILSFIPVIGQIATGVLGLFVVVGLMFVVIGKMSFADALKKIAAEAQTGPFWTLILTVFVANMISSAGIIACIIGVFFTAPLALCINVCAFNSAYSPAIPLEIPPPADTPPAP